MTCTEILSLIQRGLDNDLTPAEEEILRQHLAECSHCLAASQQMNRLHHELVSLPKVNLPYSLVDSVLETMGKTELEGNEKGSLDKGSNRQRVKKRLWLPGVAMVAGLFFALILLNERDLSPQESSLSAPLSELRAEQIQLESAPANDAQVSGSATLVTESEDTVHLFTIPTEESSLAEEKSSEEIDDTLDPELSNLPENNIEIDDGTDDEPKFSLAEFTVDEEKKYVSPDGVYTAYLGLHHEEIFIDKEDEAYYISKHSWKAPWVVEEITWLNNQQLYYVLYHPDLDEHQYWLIDVEKRTEEQLEKAWRNDLKYDRGNGNHGNESGIKQD